MQEKMNSMNDSGDFQDVESNYSGRLSHVSSQPVMIPSSRSLLTRDKRLPLTHGINLDYRKTFFGNQFSAFDSPRDHPQRIQSDDEQRNREAVPGAGRTKTIHTSEERLNHGTHYSSADICNKDVDYEFYNASGITEEVHGRTAKTANIGTAIRQIPCSTIILGVEKTIQKSSDYLFWFSIGCGSRKWRWLILWTNWNPRDQFVAGFSKLRDAGREDCLCSGQDHPEFPIQEEGQPRGTGSPERKRTGFYEEDRSPSWSTTTFEWLALMIQS